MSSDAESMIRDALERALSDTGLGPTKFRRVVELLHKAYANDVEAYVGRRLSGARAEDACAETWASVPRALESFKGESSFRTWLLRIAANKTADELRRARDRDRDALSNVISTLFMKAPSREGPSRKFARAELEHLVNKIIEELSPDDRELLLLHYRDGRKAVDIARERGLVPNTVAQRIVRARERIREALEAAGINEP